MLRGDSRAVPGRLGALELRLVASLTGGGMDREPGKVRERRSKRRSVGETCPVHSGVDPQEDQDRSTDCGVRSPCASSLPTRRMLAPPPTVPAAGQVRGRGRPPEPECAGIRREGGAARKGRGGPGRRGREHGFKLACVQPETGNGRGLTGNCSSRGCPATEGGGRVLSR